jgi:polygalacturonase
MELLRRDFLRLSSTGLAGAAAGSTLVGAGAYANALPASAESANSDFNVRRFGAKGNGTTVDSPAINQAIEAAAAAGGGTVRFPAGVYLSYSGGGIDRGL